MADSPTVLLISDRSDKSAELAGWLSRICRCRSIGLDEQPEAAKGVVGIVTDVAFRNPGHVARVRGLLGRYRGATMPVAALLRDDSRHEQVQAGALGATRVLPPTASTNEICRAIAMALEAAVPSMAATAAWAAAEHVEQARLEFHGIFDTAMCGGTFTRDAVDNATGSVVEAIADGGIRRWLEIVWAYDNTTYQHCMLVTGLAAEFARSLGLSAKDQERLTRGGLLHDLGKAKIPAAILNKPGRLTDEEMAVMRTHPVIGYELLREQGGYEPEMLEVVLRHHELLDGSGYPGGLSGSQIGDLVRLITICDIYGALIEQRPYKPPMQPARAFDILREMDGKLETALVRAFTRVVESAAPAGA